MKYIYIITFDGQIFEVKFTQEKLQSAIQAWKDGSILLFKELGGGIHGNSISKVLNEENYESYTFLVKPKLFIKDGTWYDGNERKVIRREKWKELEIEEKRQKQLNDGGEHHATQEQVDEWITKYKPNFIKNTQVINETNK